MKRVIAGLIAALSLSAQLYAQTVCSQTTPSATTDSLTTLSSSLSCVGGAGGSGAGSSSLLTNLISYWKLDEASGARADTVGSHTFTDNNTVTSQTGKINLAAEFTSGNNEYLSFAGWNAFVPESHDRAISFWFRTADVTQIKGLTGVGNSPTTGTPQWFLRLNGSHVSIYTGVYTDGTTVLTNNTWYHVVYNYTQSSGNHIVYLNGVQEISKPGDVDDVGSTDDNLYVGVAFPGYITMFADEYAAYNRTLTTTEVSCLFGGGTPPPYPFTGVCN